MHGFAWLTSSSSSSCVFLCFFPGTLLPLKKGDKDASTKLSLAEVHLIIENHLSIDLTQHQVIFLLKTLDMDHDHQLSYHELMEAVKKVSGTAAHHM